MLFALIVSIIGITFAIRIGEELIQRSLFDRQELTKIGTAVFFIVAACALLLPRTRVMLWFAIATPLFIAFFSLLALVHKRSARFRTRMIESLALLSLKMKSGRSFRQSLAEVTSESDTRMREKLSEIGSVVVFSQQNESLLTDPFVTELIEVFISIDRTPHSASRRLAVFREKLRIEDDFRRRSGQVLARLRAQSLVMTGLFLAVLTFVAVKFGWRENLEILLGSSLAFGAGAAWIWLCGRGIEWKV